MNGFLLAVALAVTNGPAIPAPRTDWAGGCYQYLMTERSGAARGQHFDFVVFGDSITMGWLYPETDASWPGGREVWQRHFGDRLTANFGVSGDRTEHVLWRIVKAGQADGWTAKTIVLAVGGNNQGQVRPGWATNDTPVQAASGVKAIRDALLARHPESKIVLVGLLPRPGKDGTGYDWMRAYNAELAKLAGGRVSFHDISGTFMAGPNEQIPSLFRDTVHPLPAGYEVYARELDRILFGKKPATRDPLRVVLTFDDALKDHLLIAAPLLEERGWRGVFNIVTDWVGKNDKMLTWEDVRELVRRGHEVTTHTVSHTNIVAVLKAGDTNEVRRQLAVSRDLIAAKTGFAPRLYCPPYGQQNDATARLSREEGLRQFSVRRYCFGANNFDTVGEAVSNAVANGEGRLDLIHHGVSAADHGGWSPFPDKASFTRHLDRIAEMERAGVLCVTDYDGCASDCALKASAWPRHGLVALSFDDRWIDAWEKAFPLFARHGATASFCVVGAIDDKAVAFARKALAQGHEIVLHGVQHRNADPEITRMGEEGYWQAEIAPQLDACRAAGIPVFSFAYPNCRRSPETDALFARHGFTRVRGVDRRFGTPNPHDPKHEKLDRWRPVASEDAQFTSVQARYTDLLISNVIMGESYHTNIDDILRAMARAGERGERLSIVSHGIAPDAKGISMKTEWLERMLAEANRLGVVIRGLR